MLRSFRGSQISSVWPAQGGSHFPLMVELVTAVYPSVEASFSTAPLHTPHAHRLLPGWPPTVEERLPAGDMGRPPQPLLQPHGVTSCDSVHHLALFCPAAQEGTKLRLGVDTINTPTSQDAPAAPAHASPARSQAPTTWTTVWGQG